MVEPSPDLVVVVVAYGPPEALAQCLDALQGEHHVLVVDNSSSPAVAALAHQAGADYLDPGKNLGYAAAVNRALELIGRGRSDVLLLNPDARIAPEDITLLQKALRDDPKAACASPSQPIPPGADLPGDRWPWHTPAGAWAEALGLHRLRRYRQFLSGAVLMLRGGALKDIGDFDERFFLYGEDEDWQRRAVKKGWRLCYCPSASAQHTGGGTDSDAARVRLRLHAATERYIRKWYGTFGWAVYRAGTLFGHTLRLVAFTGLRRRLASRAAAAGLVSLYLRGPDRVAVRAGAVPAPQRSTADRDPSL